MVVHSDPRGAGQAERSGDTRPAPRGSAGYPFISETTRKNMRPRGPVVDRLKRDRDGRWVGSYSYWPTVERASLYVCACGFMTKVDPSWTFERVAHPCTKTAVRQVAA